MTIDNETLREERSHHGFMHASLVLQVDEDVFSHPSLASISDPAR